jgi:hypothetical protein
MTIPRLLGSDDGGGSGDLGKGKDRWVARVLVVGDRDGLGHVVEGLVGCEVGTWCGDRDLDPT